MKKILFLTFLTLLYISNISAQTLTSIGGRCPSPNQGLFGTINYFGATGNIVHQPCSVGASVFLGAVDFSGATITGAITSINGQTAGAQLITTGTSGTDFNISQTGSNTNVINLPSASASNRGLLTAANWTTFNAKLGITSATINRFPYFDSTSTVANSPFSWDGTTYRWRNATSNNSVFLWDVIVDDTSGLAVLGSSSAGLTLDQTLTTATLKSSGAGSVVLQAGAVSIGDGTAGFTSLFDGSTDTATVMCSICAVGVTSGNGVRMTVTDSTRTFAFLNTANTGIFNLAGIQNFLMQRTVAVSAGNATIDKPNGIVIMEAADDEITITNNIVNANSAIYLQPQRVDESCITFIVHSKGTGSFAIKSVDATDGSVTTPCVVDTSIAFLVLN